MHTIRFDVGHDRYRHRMSSQGKAGYYNSYLRIPFMAAAALIGEQLEQEEEQVPRTVTRRIQQRVAVPGQSCIATIGNGELR